MPPSKTRLLVPLILFVLSTPTAQAQDSSLPVVRIATLLDGPWDREAEVMGEMRREIVDLVGKEFEVRFPEALQVKGDWTLAGADAALDRLLADPEVDLLITVGTMTSDRVCQRGPLPKPAIASTVIDPGLQQLPDRGGRSGVRNLNYLNLPSTVRRDLEMFREVAFFNRLVVFTNYTTAEIGPEIPARLAAQVEDMEIEATFVTVGRDVEGALAAIPDDAEAVYLMPLPQLSTAGFDSLVAGLIERRLPSFSWFGEPEVRRGILAGLNPDLFPRLTRRVAINVQRILLGEDPGTIPTAFSAGEKLTINMGTAEAIGTYPDWGLITEAELVGEAGAKIPERFYTLVTAVEEAIEVNLDLAAGRHEVEAGSRAVSEARAPLLPQIDLSAQGLVIDEDRARASFGSQSERSVSGSATLTQIVFSDPAWANYSIEKHLQTSREEGLRQLSLDIALDSAVSYFDVLRAKTLERISRENVTLSRRNLELARVRVTIGQSSASDMFRWESQIATNRKETIEFNALRNVAEIAVNRILARPLEEPFQTEEYSVEDPRLQESFPYLEYFENKLSFRKFRGFMVEEGFAYSPELEALDAQIAAVGRTHSAANRRFYLPELFLQGSISRVFSKHGEGSEPPAADFPIPDDTSWDLGLLLTYPLLEGGGKIATSKRTRQELEALRAERQSLADKIDRRIRSALHLAGATYAGIGQSIAAAEAAKNNLELVTDSYSQGRVAIVALLDAQNSYIVANEGAANAIYDFLIDLMEVQRSVGRFDFLMSPEENQAFLSRLDRYMEEHGVSGSE